MLKGHQDEIRELLGEATSILDQPEPLLSDRLEQLRWHIMRALRAYQLFKHTELFDPLTRSTIPGRATLAAEMKARCLAIGDTYTRHTREWTLSKAGNDWEAYRHTSRTMVGTITAHLQREATDAALLLHGVERTRKA